MKEKAPQQKTEGVTRREFLVRGAEGLTGAFLGGKLAAREAAGRYEVQPWRAFDRLPPGLKLAPNLPPVPLPAKMGLESFFKTDPDAFLGLDSLIPGNPRYQNILPLDSPQSIHRMSAPLLAEYRAGIQIIKKIGSHVEPPSLFEIFDSSPEPETIQGLPVREDRKDIYGNWVATRRVLADDPKSKTPFKKDIIEATSIFFPLALDETLTENEADTKIVPLNFELPTVGAKIEGFLYTVAEKPVFRIEKYNVFGNRFHEQGSHKEFQKRFSAPLTEAIQGIDLLNDLLGGENKFIRNILIVSSRWGSDDDQKMNAYIEMATPHSVHFFDDRLTSRRNLKLVGFHEAVHGMIAQLDIYTQPAFALLIKNLTPAFFHELNEMEFFNLKDDDAGHSQDNTEEFLASLINSLNRRDWQEKYLSHGNQFLSEYRACLRVLSEVLGECGQAIPHNAPIFKLLDERIDFLNTILKQ